MDKIKVIVVGCGNQGRIGARYLLEKGIKIVAAVDVNPAIVGKDLGLVIGQDQPIGVIISNDLEAVLEKTKPNVAVHAMFGSMVANEPTFNTLLRHGVNIVTTCDDSHYVWALEPEAAKRIDAVARQYGASLIGSGIQDVFFQNIGYVAAGGCITLKEIEMTVTNNEDDYGLASAKEYRVGLSVADFEQAVKDNPGAAGFLTHPINGGICARFGLTPIKTTVETLPALKDHDVYSNSMEQVIPAGVATGTIEQMVTETAEGITVCSKYSLHIYDKGEIDTVTWRLKGSPDVVVQVPGLNTPKSTMATLINRIPDAIMAAPGYHPDSDFGLAEFVVGSLEDKLK